MEPKHNYTFSSNLENSSCANKMISSSDLQQCLFVREKQNIFPSDSEKWNLRAIRKSTLSMGYHGFTYIISVEEKNIFSKYTLGPNYYVSNNTKTCRRQEWVSNIKVDDIQTITNVYVGENTMISFPSKSNINECTSIDKYEQYLIDPYVYNAYQTCLNNECAKIVEYIYKKLNKHLTVVAINYPEIIISLNGTELKRDYNEKEAENEMSQLLFNLYSSTKCKFKVINKFSIMYAFNVHAEYIACKNLDNYNNWPYETCTSNNVLCSNICDVDAFLSMRPLSLFIKTKLSMYSSPIYIQSDRLNSCMYAHESFSTKLTHAYAFFDIDMCDVDNIEEWNSSSSQLCTNEIDKFHQELCKLFRVNDFKFAISKAIRGQKVSFHFVSTCILIGDLYQFKNDLREYTFTSLLGKNIDTCVYKNNGSLRIATKYKEKPNSRICDRESKLVPITFDDNFRNHLITKLPTSECTFICPQIDYFRSLADNVNMHGDRMDYRTIIEPARLKSKACKIDILLQLINVYFTYEKCFNDSTKLFKFASCVAQETDRCGDVCNKMCAIIDASISRNKEHKINVVRKLFNGKTPIKYRSYTYYIDKLAKNNNITITRNTIISEDLQLKLRFVQNQYLSCEDLNIGRFVYSDYTRLFVKSTMGTGKTEALFRFLTQRPEHIRVLILCSRRSMVEEMKKRMIENNLDFIANSSDEKFLTRIRENPDCGLIVSTCESLYKVAQHIERFQLIVCDEMEAIIDQMSSNETHRIHLTENNYVFKYYLENAKLVAMDGQLTEHAIRMHSVPNKSIYIINEYTPKKNIKSPHDKEEFLQTISIMHKENKSIAIATDTRLACISIYEMLSGKSYDPLNIDEKFIIYNSDTSSSIDITTIDMTDKVIIYTPSMDVSVSITAYTPHMVCGYFANGQISAYCKSQMLMRFRNTSDIFVYESRNFSTPDGKMKHALFNLEYERFADLNAKKEMRVGCVLANMNGMSTFKFNNVTLSYNRFINSSINCDSGVYQYTIHKILKNMACLSDLIKIEKNPAYENKTNKRLYSKLFNEMYRSNSYKYTYGIHIESFINEIVTMNQMQDDKFTYNTPFEHKSISACIYVLMEKYQWSNLTRYSTPDMQVKGALSIIYHMNKYHEHHQYKTLEDFCTRFLGRTHIIKMFVTLMRSGNHQVQMFITLMLQSIFIEDDNKYYVDLSYLQAQSCSISLTYFKQIKISKVKYYINKFLPNVGIADSNINKRPYIDIFENSNNYINFIDKVGDIQANAINDDENISNDNNINNIEDNNDTVSIHDSLNEASEYLTRFIHRIPLNEITNYIHVNNTKSITNKKNKCTNKKNDPNIQFTIITKYKNSNRPVVLAFMRDAILKRNEISSNVYSSSVYEYTGKHAEVIMKILQTNKYIQTRPIENKKDVFINKKMICKYIDQCIDSDLDMNTYKWKTKLYEMYELKLEQTLEMLDTNIDRLTDEHQNEYEKFKTEKKRGKFNSIVIYKPKPVKPKKLCGLKNIYDINDIEDEDVINCPQGIISEYKKKLILKRNTENACRLCHEECNNSCVQNIEQNDDDHHHHDNMLYDYNGECECLYCLPNQVIYYNNRDKNSIAPCEILNEESKGVFSFLNTYREICMEYLQSYEGQITNKMHDEFAKRDKQIVNIIESIADDPTCYTRSNDDRQYSLLHDE